MPWPVTHRRWIIPAALIGCGLAVCAWQGYEHVRFVRGARAALIKRGRDITSTLGVVLRSQRRFGWFVVKERIEPSLEALIEPEELESIAVLAANGEPLASAGHPVDLRPEVLRAGGVYWGDRTLTLMNLMDLGSGNADSDSGPAPTIVTSDEDRGTLRPRRPGRPPGPDGGRAGPPTARAALGRPPWMTAEQFNTVIQQKGAHSLVVALSTDEMRREIRSDLVRRALVSLLTLGAVGVSALAWRNAGRTAELQIGLVKAAEMNTHLKAMNFAAAGLAHETRNPLNLIRGLAQMIAKSEPASPLREHAVQIVEEADRVTMQLNDFINYSKPREAHPAPVEVQGLVADVARTLRPDIEEKQIELVQPEAPCFVEADDRLLRQAVFNVLLNASQAVAPGGRIRVQVAPVGAGEAVLEVSDDGPGVPAAERENIFKPYVTMRAKGAGLGLAIVSQIAAAHRWEVTCGPNEPRGARFRFTHLRLASPYA
jgi:signal transduction histidine kinase